MARQTALEVDKDAADWAAKADRGLSTEEQMALELWLQGDVRRPGAYARVRARALQSERAVALGLHYDPADFAAAHPARPAATRRAVMSAGASLAASAAGLTIFGLWGLGRRQTYSTKKGELRQVVLADGTVATLNTASLMSVKFSQGRRDVVLAGGEVLFDVAKDASRPFYVSAGSTRVRVVGTSFSVTRLKDKPVQVLVREGIVEVSRNGAGPTDTVRLVANTRAVDAAVETAPFAVDQVADPELRRQLAWRGGRIEFDGQTLEQAAAEFGRYSDIRIVIADPALAREEIAGLYQSTDPVGFAQSVAASLDARAEVVNGEVQITR